MALIQKIATVKFLMCTADKKYLSQALKVGRVEWSLHCTLSIYQILSLKL